MLGFHPIAATPLAALLAADELVVLASGGLGAGGGGGQISPSDLLDELRRMERRQKRVPKTHVIKVGDWPEDVGHIETDPLDWREIITAQPRRQDPPPRDGDDEEALMELLMFVS